MPNAVKFEKVAALKDRIEGSNALLLAEFRGLSVHDATELRRSLSDHARFSVVKNTLMQRAAGEAGIGELEPLLSGPTAVAFVQGDVIAVAKRVVDAAKRFPALVLKGAYMDGKVLGPAEAQALATLESREVMLSKVAGMMKAEMTRAASMFQALQGRFVGLLEAYREKLPGAEPEAAAEEPSAPEPPAEEPSEAPVAETGPGETEEAPTAETAPETDTAEPAEAEAPAEEPEAAVEQPTTEETGEDEDVPAGSEEE